MPTKAKKFESLQSLDREIRRLKLKAKQMENDFDSILKLNAFKL